MGPVCYLFEPRQCRDKMALLTTWIKEASGHVMEEAGVDVDGVVEACS